MERKIKRTDCNGLSVVVQPERSVCRRCARELPAQALVTYSGEDDLLCLSCSDLDHLQFLAAGDRALTLRSQKHSRLWAMVLQWNRRRNRFQRLGLLVERAALVRAKQECLADEAVRLRRRERQAGKRQIEDEQYLHEFSLQIRRLYPLCPPGRETIIAHHACCKYSGRVGRAAFARELRPKAIELAVLAHIRHTETEYDELLAAGMSRNQARQQVESRLWQVLASWQTAPPAVKRS
jgi:hypothetical protein